MEAGLRALLEKAGYLGKSTVQNEARRNNWSKVDAWNFVHSLADGRNYHAIEVFGHPHVSANPNLGKIDPDADKKKVLAFIKQNKIVSKNKLDQWAESDLPRRLEIRLLSLQPCWPKREKLSSRTSFGFPTITQRARSTPLETHIPTGGSTMSL
jgi:hypothetical protein